MMATPESRETSRVVRVPGDKSISHRSLICAALASGRSRIRNILRSADVESTAGVLRALGAIIPTLAADVRVDGCGLRNFIAPGASLDCGNSGTTARLMAGVLSAHPFASRLEGDESLSRRPMGRVARPLEAMGARFAFERGQHLPLTITGGTLQPLSWDSPTASAQVKSAILLAGLVGGVRVTVTEPVRSRDHTERMLAALGVEVRSCGRESALEPTHELPPFQVDVPADPSSAAFLAALAAAGGVPGSGSIELTDVALNPTRLGFFRVLRDMGAEITWEVEREECGEPVGTLRVKSAAMRAATVGGDLVPAMIDELPMLACLATRADGETVITGARELRVKESDRIASVVANLRAVGADADELPDGLRVRGTAAPLRGTAAAHGDHRLAMAFGVLGALPGNAIVVDDPACVSVSYPAFWNDLERLTT